MTIKDPKKTNTNNPNNDIENLLNIMKKLRDKETGCPWDQVQSFESIAKYTIEEAYEVNDAILEKNWENLKEELGDLLLQVVYHSEIASELKLFNFKEVVDVVSKKMINRHPHVFKKNVTNKTVKKQIEDWEKIKRKEKENKLGKNSYLLDDVTKSLPALTRAEKIQKKAALVNFDWQKPQDVLDKLQEESKELLSALENNDDANIEEEIGDILFTIVNLSRKLNIDPENALRKSNKKFQYRMNGIEDELKKDSKKIDTQTPSELERLWELQKEKK